MLIDWTTEFAGWLDRIEERAAAGDGYVERLRQIVTVQLGRLQDLTERPEANTATLRRVEQSGKWKVWRVSHPYTAGVALRLIVWFPDTATDTVVVALFAGDKARMGDVFYNSVGTRADAAIAKWIHQTGDES